MSRKKDFCYLSDRQKRRVVLSTLDVCNFNNNRKRQISETTDNSNKVFKGNHKDESFLQSYGCENGPESNNIQAASSSPTAV